MTPIDSFVVVGGGTAGWLTAGLLAASHSLQNENGKRLTVTVIESDTVHPIGVGEGTWPTMRSTLAKIGIAESEVIKHASATFKQASKFVDWHTHQERSSYYHPFSAPQGSANIDITPYWLTNKYEAIQQYAQAVCFQPTLCDQGLAPKLGVNAKQSFSANYGFHLDAGKFITLLRNHCTNNLGVKHIVDDVTDVVTSVEGINYVTTANSGHVYGDMFVDCSGFSALLIEKALKVSMVDASNVLFSDSALVHQLPYADTHQPIACHTLSTAQEAGWIWDIGLQERRGTGYVYSSRYQSGEEATATLSRYIKAIDTNAEIPESFRKISYKTGYREKFWEKNCVSIGLSSGFLEPLEASSLMLIEQSASQLAEQLPACREVMPHVAKRFNASLTYKWQRTIEFLKLHYLLSNRNEAFWLANKAQDSIPERLQLLLEEWQYRPVLDSDFSGIDEVFSAQSYRYILYGMAHSTQVSQYARSLTKHELASKQFQLNKSLIMQLTERLPSHRGLIDTILTAQ
ncbi:tryptophan 7-halogenase [Alteromonas sp. 1_MG-2023]|uniref:tryptophan halogenase family protein n=1 Tax=Alteromonas sp. 1_MG-2023 TaxID=3062669 RepID=UPI0026E33186|nr:tryptophan halogenase family protein [Alteromonas sp. 1_MG-2023]MDO6566676.1 tryptophan 7-halogenase [Alteromonas sp. 1_MG-2023]